MVYCQEISFAISHYFKHHQYPCQTQTSSIIQLLFILSGSVEINPGPRALQFSCRECHKALCICPLITWDICDQWFHTSCVNMNNIIFETYQNNDSMECLCCSYGLPNVGSKLFDIISSQISSVSSISIYPVRCKANSLPIY